MSSLAISKAQGAEVVTGIIAREEFGARQLMQQAERAAVAAAAQAKAEVESRYVMAMRNRRDWDDIRVSLLADCDRLEFAKASRYKVPNRGEGWTIRFVEAAVQRMTNVYVPAFVIYEDDERRIKRVTATDLETNVTWPVDVTILKTIERKDATGREIVRSRQTSAGAIVYIVRATDEELLVKENALVSKAARTNCERLIPPDLKEECKRRVLATIAKGISDDPDAERKQIADGFASIGVSPKDLKEYLGCELGQLTDADLGELRELFVAIREGHTTWRDLLSEKRVERGAEEPEDTRKGSSALKEKLSKRQSAHVIPDFAELPEITPDMKPGQQATKNGLLHEINDNCTAWTKVQR